MNDKTYKKHFTVWIIITVVLAAGSFFAGSTHGQTLAKTALAQARGGFTMGAGAGRGGNRFGTGGGVVSGSVISKDDTSMTVKMRDGSSKIVLYSGSTQVSKSAAGSASDVIVGTQISVIGTQNSDGSVTAQTVQIRPQ